MKLEEVRFSDGEVWDTEKIEELSTLVVYGDNVIYCGKKVDTIWGGKTNDTIYGGGGNDYLSGGLGNNTLVGGEGSDVYYYDAKNGGNDVIIGDKYDTLEISLVSANDIVKERLLDSKDLVLKIVFDGVCKGQITLKDYYLSDENKIKKIVFYPDETALTYEWTKEQIESNVTIVEPIIKGTSGDDVLNGTDRDDVLLGDKGNDILSGGNGVDTYIYSKGDGSDIITDGTADKLEFKDISSGDVNFIRKNNDLVIAFKDTSDTSEITLQNWFISGAKLSEIKFADGSDWTTADIEMKLLKGIYGTDANNSITGTAADEIIYAKAGDDRVYGKDGNDTILAGEGNDKVYGGNGDDILYGEEGDDSLYGDAGDDRLLGGKGDDYLSGGEGSNTYIINKGDGNDTIYDLNNITATGLRSIDTIRFAGFVREDIQDKIKEGYDLVIKFESYKVEGLQEECSNSVRIKNYFASNDTRDYKIEKFEFDDVVLSSEEIENSLNSYGTDGNDSITGTAGNNTIYGRKGDDTIRGLAEKDVIYGEEDNDKIYGGDGNDELSGGAGDDKLYGEGGNDILDGGTGNDYLSGGEGSNCYIYKKGDGNDIIEDRNYSADKTNWSYDKLKLEGINTSDIESVTRTGYDFIIKIKNEELTIENGGTETITFKNWFYGDVANSSYNFKTEEIEFADGTKWSSSDIQQNLTIYGTDNNDSIVDTSEGNTIYAKAGDDRVYGKDGNDVILAGEGNDKVYGGNGDDILYGEDGDDSLYGDAGDDRLLGGTGDDYLSGSEGSNTYIINKGDGNDTIYDLNNIATTGLRSIDTIRFAGFVREDIQDKIKEGYDLIIKIKNGQLTINNGEEETNSIRIKNYFASNDTRNYKIERFEFDDVVLSSEEIESSLNSYGTDGNDSITGTAGNNTIYGRKGDDTLRGLAEKDVIYGEEDNDKIYGGDGNDELSGGDGDDKLYGEGGNDILDGGTGNDYLSGGEGSNCYIYKRGDGNDIIEDRNYSAEKTNWSYDKLKLEGILPSDIESVTRIGYDFIIKIKNEELTIENGGTETITFKNWFYGDVANSSYNFKTEEIEFADGTKWSSSDIQQNLTVYGTDNNDSIVDTSEGNTIYAKAGDDRIYGKDGNDLIYAGEGNDKVYGGTGDDTLRGEDGDDSLYGEYGNDTLVDSKGNDYFSGGTGTDTAVFEGNLGEYKVLTNSGKQYVFKQNTSYNEIDTLLNIESLKFADQTQSADYSNFTNTDTLKYIASYQEMINQYGVSVAKGNWSQSINNANKNFVTQGYKNGLGNFDSMGYLNDHKAEVESVFGKDKATEENGLKLYISKEKANK